MVLEEAKGKQNRKLGRSWKRTRSDGMAEPRAAGGPCIPSDEHHVRLCVPYLIKPIERLVPSLGI